MSLQNTDQIHILDLLTQLSGKEVTLILNNGAQLTGTLSTGVDYSSLSIKSICLSSLAEKDFFDAVIAKTEVIGCVFRNR